MAQPVGGSLANPKNDSGNTKNLRTIEPTVYPSKPSCADLCRIVLSCALEIRHL